MLHSVFGLSSGNRLSNRTDRDRKLRPLRLDAKVEGLERRELLTSGGSVTLQGGVVTIVPTMTGANTAVVSYQTVGHVAEVDVRFNGVDNYFTLKQVGLVVFDASNATGSETFQNETSISTDAYGGSGSNLFIGGSGIDAFYGGSGSNTFDAGSGYDVLAGGTGSNVYNESATGSGLIIEAGNTNTINVPLGSTGSYTVI